VPAPSTLGRTKTVVVIGYRDSYFTAEGKGRYLSAKKRKDEAEKSLRQAMADAERGRVFDVGMLTVGKYLEK
jgi:integrase